MKNKLLSFIIGVVLLLTIQPQMALATTAGSSASFRLEAQKPARDYRVDLLRNYLKQYKSPLADEAETFVSEADKYQLDYRLLPAMAGVESWFGTRLPANSYNAWGWGIYGTHMTYFTTWDDGIHTISKELRERYMDKWGDRNVYEIGRHYASDEKWAGKVMHFIYDMEAYEKKTTNKAISISV